MSTRKLQLPVSGFTDGLNTEASVLNVLPSEFMDGTTNVELFQNGSVRRRRGVDFLGASDAGGFLQTIRTSAIASELTQESPAAAYVILTAPNGSLVEKIVLDINNEFWIFDVTSDSLTNIDSPSQKIIRTVDGILHSHDNQKFVNMQFSQSGNRLFFAGKHIHSGYLEVAPDNTTLEVVYINLITRDPDATEENTRKSNNGKWYECYKDHTSSAANEPGVGVDSDEFWFANDGAILSGVGAWGSGNAFTTTFLNRYDKRTSVEASDTFPSTVDFFAGRAWFGGDPKFPNSIYFSQVVINDGDLEKYHQFADPFSSVDSAIVEDDGGVVAIQGAGLIIRLLAISNSIFAGSNNGIRQLTGASGGSFKATDFVSFSVLEDGIDGPENMVKVDDEFVVFAQDTIWRSTIQTNIYVSTTGQASFKSLSEARVETLYAAIPASLKAAARAIYNPSERRVYYFYNKTSTDFDNSYSSLNQPGYTKDVLVLDTRFQDEILPTEQQQKAKRRVKGAFFSYTFNDGANIELPYIACPFVSPDVPPVDEPVVAAGVIVTNSAADPIVAAGTADPKDVILLLSMRKTKSGANSIISAAFASLNTTTVKDWNSSSTYSISYTSPIFAGIQTGGDTLHAKNLTYIYLVFKKVESGTLGTDNIDITPGGCFLATAWDYAINKEAPGHSKFFEDIVTTTGVHITDSLGIELYKRNPMREVYHPTRLTNSLAGAGDDGYDHVHFKHRVRGRGNSFQMLFLNDNDKDYHLVGWVEQFYGKPD